ncbi:GTPase Der [Rickettsia prowazekii str. Cairo 3]|nr:GTPase Der [Rickettsia prowazekii str. Cairo 3]
MVKRRINSLITTSIIIGVFIINMLYISQLQKAITLILKVGIETEYEDV